MAKASQRKTIDTAVLDDLLQGRDAAEVFQSGELLTELKQALAERALHAELAHHLEGADEPGEGNHRNGFNRKRVLIESGPIDLSVPRDRHGRFAPQLVEKYCRRLPGFDAKALGMYPRGMSTRDIQAQV